MKIWQNLEKAPETLACSRLFIHCFPCSPKLHASLLSELAKFLQHHRRRFFCVVVQLLSSFKYIALLLTKLRTQSPLINGWVKPWQRWFWSRLLARCAKEMLLENWLCFTTSEEQLQSYAKKSQSSLELTNLILTRLLNIPKSNH